MRPPISDTEVAERLLTHLRGVTERPKLDYARPPRAITGGFDTRIFRFKLANASAELSVPLILRLYSGDDDPLRALWESVVQSTVVSLGYPAPRIFMEYMEIGVLGGSFLVMERLPGAPMLAASTPIEVLLRARWMPRTLPGILAEHQARLHSLDPERLMRAVDASGLPQEGVAAAGVSGRMLTIGGQLDQLERRIQALKLVGLQPALKWLLDNRPLEVGEKVICHGDFHPLNVIMTRGRVTGVVDWAMTVVADPAFDVASTRVLLGMAPLNIPAILDAALAHLRPIVVRRYTEAYERIRDVDHARLAYYEALRCLVELAWVSERRLTGAGSLRNPWGAPREAMRLISHFRLIAGVSPKLPPIG